MATKTSAKRQQELELEVEYLKTRLKETIDAFTAIRQGEVDAFVVPSPQGAQVYILEGIERRYRAIVETMNEAALILSTDGTILYCNSQFAQMLDLNLMQVMGDSLQNLIAKADRERCAAFLRECVQWRSKVDLGLVGSAGKQIMAELSGSPLQLEASTGVCLVVTDITERKEAEAALRQNERKIRLITENMQDTIFAYDMNHQLIFVNSAFKILTGYTIGELYARNFINYLHPDDATRMISLWEDVFQGKAFAGEEFRIVRKDGQIRWCASSWSPLIDEQGQQIGIQGREIDITERQRAEDALRESEMKVKTLIELLPVGVSILNAENKLIYSNPILERILGISREGLMRGNYRGRRYLRPDGSLMSVEEYASQRAIKEQKVISGVEIGVEKENGNIVWTSVSAVPVSLSDWRVVIVTADITERKRVEEALRESEEKYRTLVENIPGSEFRCEATPPRRVIHQSTEIENLSGYPASDFLDGSILFDDIELPEDVEKVNQAIESAIADKKSYIIEYRLRHANGSIHWVSERGHVTYSEQGEPLWLDGIIFDITEQKQIEKALQESEERYRLLFENAQIGIGYYDASGHLLLINDLAASDMGGKRADFTGKTISELFGNTYIGPIMMERMADIFGTGESKEYEDWVQLPSGDKYFYSVYNGIFDAEGKPVGLQIISHDITERKRAEKALQENEIRYRELFDNISSGVAIYEVKGDGEDFIFKDFNKAGERMDGDCKEDIIGKSIFEARPGIKEFGLLEVFKRVWRTGLPEYFPLGIYQDNRLSGWYENYVYRLPSGEIVAVYDNVTERKRAEEEIQSLAKFPSENPYPVLRIARDGMLLFINEAGLNRLPNWHLQVGMAVPLMLRDVVFQTLEGGTTQLVDLEHCERVYSFFVTPIVDAGYANLYGRDITERKRVEEALRTSEARFSTVFHASPLTIVITRLKDNTIIDVNEAWQKMTGFNREKAIGCTPIELNIWINPDERKRLISSLREQGIVQGFEFQMRQKSGNIKDLLISAEQIEVAGEQCMLSMALDITERNRTEKALQESEERFRSFSEAAFEAIAIHEEGVLISANDQFFEMFGYKPDELLGKQVISLVIAPKARKYMRSQIAKGGRGHYESIGLRKDGTKFPVEIRDQEMEYKGRKVRVVVLRDITERIQAETEREALLQQVRASQDELRTLAAYLQTALEDERTSIAREIHDEFGQRLTAFKMDLAWLSTRITPAEPQVQEKMAVMTSMLQELIQYTRQVASNLRPGLLDDLGLNATIEWYANDWNARHGKGIFIHLPDNELPLNREMSTTLYRILQETLTNVARHAEATRVDVYLEMADDHVILQVRDNGRGISQNEIHSSTALGLLGMRERAYQFGGGLEISGKPGKGTTVHVRLPLKQGA